MPIGALVSAGMNAKAASMSYDRQKKWAQRHWNYDLIGLENAGINPGYIFADGAGGQSGSMKMPMSSGSGGSGGMASLAGMALLPAQAKLLNSVRSRVALPSGDL